MAVTNADRTETIRWYQKHYDYRQLGTLNKLCDFSLSDVDCSTTLEMDLEDWMRLRPARGRAATPSWRPPIPTRWPSVRRS
jgi:ribosomal-protein-alanine N-acetyltransferase